MCTECWDNPRLTGVMGGIISYSADGWEIDPWPLNIRVVTIVLISSINLRHEIVEDHARP